MQGLELWVSSGQVSRNLNKLILPASLRIYQLRFSPGKRGRGFLLFWLSPPPTLVPLLADSLAISLFFLHPPPLFSPPIYLRLSSFHPPFTFYLPTYLRLPYCFLSPLHDIQMVLFPRPRDRTSPALLVSTSGEMSA